MSVGWQVRIEGAPDSLRRLGKVFDTEGHRVVLDSEGHTVLESTILDNVDTRDVSTQAEQLVELLNGSMRAVDPSFEPVRFARHLRHPEYGVRRVVSDSLDTRWRVESNDPADAQDFARHYCNLALVNPDVSEVLLLLRQPKLEWGTLYKVFEVIRQDLGGEAQVIAAGWATGNELSSFRAAANRPDVGGTMARHARVAGPAPCGSPFTLNAGQNFVLRLAKRWMQKLLAAS